MTGADGNLWLTEYYGNRIVRWTLSGTTTSFQLGDATEPTGIAAGPDGNIWVIESYPERIARLTL